MQPDIDWVIKNWAKIPEQYKEEIVDGKSSKVVLLLDRQKPSVEADYSFDEERITINEQGQIIWGFDSGCSCPSPWHDSAPQCYSCTESWKEFVVNDLKGFDPDALEAVAARIDEMKKA